MFPNYSDFHNEIHMPNLEYFNFNSMDLDDPNESLDDFDINMFDGVGVDGYSFAESLMDTTPWDGSSKVVLTAASEPDVDVKASLPALSLDWNKKLLQAVKDRDFATIREALQNGASTTSDVMGMTTLHLAAVYGDLQLIRTLKPTAAGLESRNRVGRTVLHCACAYGRDAIVDYLLNEMHVDVNVGDMLNNTALHWAVKHEHRNIISMLLKANATVDVRNKFGETPNSLAKGSLYYVDISEELDARHKLQEQFKIEEEQRRLAEETKAATNAIKSAKPDCFHFLESFDIDETTSFSDNDNDTSKKIMDTVAKAGRQVVLSDAGRMIMEEYAPRPAADKVTKTPPLQPLKTVPAIGKKFNGTFAITPNQKSTAVRIIHINNNEKLNVIKQPAGKIIKQLPNSVRPKYVRPTPYAIQSMRMTQVTTLNNRKPEKIFEVPREYASESTTRNGDVGSNGDKPPDKTANKPLVQPTGSVALRLRKVQNGAKLFPVRAAAPTGNAHPQPAADRPAMRPINISEIVRQLSELRRSHAELRQSCSATERELRLTREEMQRAADAFKTEREEVRARLEKLEAMLLAAQQNAEE